MRGRPGAGIAVAVVLLAGCSIKGGPIDPGSSTFPLPGPLPPVGTEWQTDDGLATPTLGPDRTARVSGLPWYLTTSGDCDEKDLEFVSANGKVLTIVNPNASTINFTVVVSDTETGVAEATSTFWRSTKFEGWQVLNYSSCVLFNDGHNLVFHMVKE